jgi:hypothetical protein
VPNKTPDSSHGQDEDRGRENPGYPDDDTFGVASRQASLRQKKSHTYRAMEKVWEQIQASLRTDASRMKWDNR